MYAWRGRCFPCHHSDQTLADKLAPRWLSVEGSCDAGAVQTLRTVIDSGYLNSDDPEDSLLLRKPLAIEAGGIEHGGGEKFHDQTDFAYQSFLSFIQYWSSCVTPASRTEGASPAGTLVLAHFERECFSSVTNKSPVASGGHSNAESIERPRTSDPARPGSLLLTPTGGSRTRPR